MNHYTFSDNCDYDLEEYEDSNRFYQNTNPDNYNAYKCEDDDYLSEITSSSPSFRQPDMQIAHYPNQCYDEIEEYDDYYNISPDDYFPQSNNICKHASGYPETGSLRQSSNSSTTHNQTQTQYHKIQPHENNDLPQATDPCSYNQLTESVASSDHVGLEGVPGIHLRPVSDLPDIYRGIFKFGVFNRVQSTCYNDVVKTNQNMVISAPTGSGKTVLFELSIIRMLTEVNNTGKNLKCVYMAPTKALCSERFRDWSTKFHPLGIKCCELTGDTVHFGRGAWGDAKNSAIIITTGEKWDSLTRNWRDHGQTLSTIQLFLVDEVHILNETRGSTLEVVVSRMKTHGSSVRFVLVSATVPNICDIASWIGSQDNSGKPAKIFEFGEDFRPCKLSRIVIGVPRGTNQNDFAFNKTLDFRLFSALQQHSVGKPILVFCSTRKGVFTTAEHLMKDYIEAEKSKKHLPWSHSSGIDQSFHDKRLTEFAAYGIGVHHAGLTMEDRRATEDLYLRRILRIVVATSTLAVGVNLPAHTVVIKGVQTFQNNTSIEYSDLDVMQMLGRAGRPQFDKDGIAIILCEIALESKYRAMAQGKTILESSLHKNLTEHLNSEIGLGTIRDINSAKEWLRGSFLFQRIRKNPAHYALGKDDSQTWEERVDNLVTQSVSILQSSGLVESPTSGNESGTLTSTEYGDIMNKFYIRQSTMGLILALPERPTLREILEMIAGSEELCETKMRASEKSGLNKLKRHNDIRFEIKKLEKTSDKVFLLIQAILGGISLNNPEYRSADSQPNIEAFGIFRHVTRIARAVVEVGVVKKLGGQVKYGLELVRCLTAKAWEDRPVVLRQIEQIGEKSLKVLAEHGITSLQRLREQDSLRIETLLNRRAPFGLEVLRTVQELPQYSLRVNEVSVAADNGNGPVTVELLIECGLENVQAKVTMPKKAKGRGVDMTAVLTTTSDLDLLDFRRIPTKVLTERKSFEIIAELTRPSQTITVLITSETIAGVKIEQVYKPKVSPNDYPTMDTHPPTMTEVDLVGLEDDPDFWNMEDSCNEEQTTAVRDLTKKKPELTKSESPQIKHSGVLQPSSRSVPEPKKLPNGNFACNHPCKNKAKCRHLCCRDGLSEPPNPPKKKVPSGVEQSKTDGLPPKRNNIITARKITGRKLDDLERLHEHTSNIKLANGQRLKISSPSELKQKRKPLPDFKLEFANLGDSSSSNSTYFEVNEIDDDKDDLPEAHSIVAIPSITGRSPPSDTNYSNSEVDSLICAIPLEEIKTKKSQSHQYNPLKRKLSDEYQGRNMLPDARIKQALSSPFPEKHARYMGEVRVDDSSPINISFHSKDEDTTNSSTVMENVLFLDGSDLEQSPLRQQGSPEADEEFSIDSDYLEAPASPDVTVVFTDDNQVGWETTNADGAKGFRSPRPAYENVQRRNEDEFAELDAWLTSGAVEIVE